MEEEKVIHHIYGRSHNTLHFNKTCFVEFSFTVHKKNKDTCFKCISFFSLAGKQESGGTIIKR